MAKAAIYRAKLVIHFRNITAMVKQLIYKKQFLKYNREVEITA